MTAQVTLIGNLVRDPELRFTPKGDAVANFTVAVNERMKQGDEWVDGEPSYYDVTAWRKLGEDTAENLLKGARVVVVGKMKIDKYETKDGQQRSKVVVTADEIGSSIRARRVAERSTPKSPEPDPWATPVASEEIPPF
jgi:single-strand DNA-binding protein